jgi:translation initiation factor IF-2
MFAESDTAAKEMAELRLRFNKQQVGSVTSTGILATAAGLTAGTVDTRSLIKVPFVLKADGGGTIEAIVNYLNQASESDPTTICKADVVYSAIGDVSTSDIALASAAKATIIAFNTAASTSAKDDARASNVDIQYFNVLYDFLDFVSAEFKKIIFPPLRGTRLGMATIKKVFKLGKAGKVAGCEVTEGMLVATASVRILRGKEEVFSGKMASLKVMKEKADEVPAGSECGVVVDGFDDYQEDDVVECFTTLQ